MNFFSLSASAAPSDVVHISHTDCRSNSPPRIIYCITTLQIHWYRWAKKDWCDQWNYNADDATTRALRKTFVLTPAMKVTVDPSVEQETTNLTYAKNQQMVAYKICFNTVIHYQRISINFAILIRLALQQYEKYNNFLYGVLGTNRVFPLTHLCSWLYS
jgi:hypothetical protein